MGVIALMLLTRIKEVVGWNLTRTPAVLAEDLSGFLVPTVNIVWIDSDGLYSGLHPTLRQGEARHRKLR
jgi:hypothetical protein